MNAQGTIQASSPRPSPPREEREQSKIPWTKHPIVDVIAPPLSVEELKAWARRPNGEAMALEYWTRREALIREAQEDPLRQGFELGFWKDVRALLGRKDCVFALGGNGPGKTEIGGKLVSETLCNESSRKVLCVATNENASKQLQQPAVYKYLPPATRARNEKPGPQKREHVTKVKYTPAGGFTEGTFVLPNRSQCWFKTTRQYLDDPTSFEGPEYDLVWIDEPAPVTLLDTLGFRVAKRGGKMFLTFTAIHGFDAVCSRALTGARLVKSLPMNYQWATSVAATGRQNGNSPSPRLSPQGEGEATSAQGAEGGPDPKIVIPELDMKEVQVKGAPAGHMPYMMQPLNPAHGVIFLWTHWNIFLPRSKRNPNLPAVFDETRGKGKAKARIRLFGWADKISGCQYPAFNPDVHVVPLSKVPKVGTVYMSADPATARSYFILWVLVDPLGRKFVFDESPRFEEGEWVGEDGQKGEGQRLYAGRGSKWYKGYMRQREREHLRAAGFELNGWVMEPHERTPMRRKGDPRAFATEAAARDGGENLFEMYEHDDRSEDYPDAGPMAWEPAKVRSTIYLDLEKVNNELAYDEDLPISIENEPKVYVADRCQNLIRAMLNWNPEQGGDSPWKDPNDTLRYLFDEPLFYVDPKVPECVGGRGW